MENINATNSETPHVAEIEGKVENVISEKAGCDDPNAPLDPETLRLEQKLKWKLDLYILPLLSMVYFFASMVKPPEAPAPYCERPY